jgi:hypothetical protein
VCKFQLCKCHLCLATKVLWRQLALNVVHSFVHKWLNSNLNDIWQNFTGSACVGKARSRSGSIGHKMKYRFENTGCYVGRFCRKKCRRMYSNVVCIVSRQSCKFCLDFFVGFFFTVYVSLIPLSLKKVPVINFSVGNCLNRVYPDPRGGRPAKVLRGRIN